MPIQLRCFNNIWPFFTKVAPLPVWFLHPWLSATNGFYRNYQQLGGGGKMGGQKIIWGGGHLPPLAPPPLGAATAASKGENGDDREKGKGQGRFWGKGQYNYTIFSKVHCVSSLFEESHSKYILIE